MTRLELNRAIELLLEKEQFTEPDCWDRREANLPFWNETEKGKELEVLLIKRKLNKELGRL